MLLSQPPHPSPLTPPPFHEEAQEPAAWMHSPLNDPLVSWLLPRDKASGSRVLCSIHCYVLNFEFYFFFTVGFYVIDMDFGCEAYGFCRLFILIFFFIVCC